MEMEQFYDEMDARAFKAKMEELLPDADPEAVQSLVFYAGEQEQDGECSKDEFFREAYVEFNLITRHHGRELSLRLLDVCKAFPLNPSELRGAAKHLSYGIAPDRIGSLALDGKCERTASELMESDEALDAFEDGVLKIPRRNKPAPESVRGAAI